MVDYPCKNTKLSPPPLPSRTLYPSYVLPVAVLVANEESTEGVNPPLPPRPGVAIENKEINSEKVDPSCGAENEIRTTESTEAPLTEVAMSHHHKKKKSCVVAVSYSPIPGTFASISSVPTVIGTTSANSDLNCALLSHENVGAQIVHKANFTGHSKPLRSICFSKDGSRLATASQDGHIMLWSVCTYQLIWRSEKVKSQLNAIAISNDDRLLVTGSEEKEICLFSMDSGKLLQPTLSDSHAGPIRSLAFSPDSKILASAGADKRVFLWNSAATNNVPVCKLAQLCGHTNPLRVVKFAPNSEIIVTGGEDKTARIFLSNMISTQDNNTPVINNVSFGKPDWTINFEKSACIWDIDFTPNSAFFAVALGAKSANITTNFKAALGSIAIVNVSTRTICASVQAHGSCCRTVSWCPTGEAMLASGGTDGTVRIFLWPCKDLQVDLNEKKKIFGTYKVNGRPLPTEYRPMLLPAHPLDCEEVNVLWKFNDGIVIVESVSTESNLTKGLAAIDSLRKKRDFFSLLDEGASQNWTSYKLLTEMQTTIVDVQELKLFYTACNAAYKLGHLTLEMRNDLLTQALHAAPETIKFDQKSQVLARLKLILGKARKDNIINEAESLQIDANIDKANVYADYRFLTLAERVTNLEERVERVESYATAIDKKLFTFQSMFRENKQRMNQVLIIKVIFSIVTLGMGSVVGSVLADTASVVMNTFDNVVDFSDVEDIVKVASQDKDVESWSDVSEVAYDYALEDWAEAPLESYVKKNQLTASQASLAGMIRLANTLDASQNNRSHQELVNLSSRGSSPISTRSSTSILVSESKLPQPNDLTTLISITGANSVDLPIDNRFEMAFEHFYDVDLDEFGDNALELLARFIDKDSSNTIDQLEWATFCRKVKKRGSISAFFDWLSSL
mmetsp:Transcript_17477/g.26286  ORF Transcript_17477/g.26286 Transcript_17477/m.26286 type:complete len:907 (+) Transcript_17477:116-2836(+)